MINEVNEDERRKGAEAEETVQGSYNVNQGLLSVEGTEMEGESDLMPCDCYRLILKDGGNSLEGLSRGADGLWANCFRAKAF